MAEENIQPGEAITYEQYVTDSAIGPNRTVYVPMSSMNVFIGNDCENLVAMRGWSGITAVIVAAAVETGLLCCVIVMGETQEAVDRLADHIEAKAPSFADLTGRNGKLKDISTAPGHKMVHGRSTRSYTKPFVISKRSAATLFSDKGRRFQLIKKEEGAENLESLKEDSAFIGTPSTTKLIVKGGSEESVARAVAACKTLAAYFPSYTGLFFNSASGEPVLSLSIRVLPPGPAKDPRDYFYYHASKAGKSGSPVEKFLHPELTIAPTWDAEYYTACILQGLKKGLLEFQSGVKVVATAGKTIMHSRDPFFLDSIAQTDGCSSHVEPSLRELYNLLSRRKLQHFQTSNRNSAGVMANLRVYMERLGYVHVEHSPQYIELHFVESLTQLNYMITLGPFERDSLSPCGFGQEDVSGGPGLHYPQDREQGNGIMSDSPVVLDDTMTIKKFKLLPRRLASLNFLREGSGADFMLNVETQEISRTPCTAIKTWIKEEWNLRLKDKLYVFDPPTSVPNYRYQMLGVRYFESNETIWNHKFKVQVCRVMELRNYPPMLAGLHHHDPVWEVKIQSLNVKKVAGSGARDMDTIMLHIHEFVREVIDMTEAMGSLQVMDIDHGEHYEDNY